MSYRPPSPTAQSGAGILTGRTAMEIDHDRIKAITKAVLENPPRTDLGAAETISHVRSIVEDTRDSLNSEANRHRMKITEIREEMNNLIDSHEAAALSLNYRCAAARHVMAKLDDYAYELGITQE